MAYIEWTSNLEIGIKVIDGQHRRIVDYINRLHEVSDSGDRGVTDRVIGELIDYTYSHFAFEEALMEEAGYDSLAIHQRTHQAFCARVDDFKRRAEAGEDIAPALADLLQHWLLEHIQHDDVSYAGLVREALPRLREQEGGSWLGNAVRRFFN
jgi:hemerythrin